MKNSIAADKLTDPQKNLLQQTGFHIAHGKITPSSEHVYLPTFRVGAKGTREVIAVDFMQLVDYLSVGAASKVPPKTLYKWMEETIADEATKFMKFGEGHAVYFATIGPRDCLYPPAGFSTLEKVGPEGFSGIRVAVMSVKDQEALTKINRYLISISKSSDVLQDVCNKVGLHA